MTKLFGQEYFKNDHNLRELVYEVLSVESSFKAQKVWNFAIYISSLEFDFNCRLY